MPAAAAAAAERRRRPPIMAWPPELAILPLLHAQYWHGKKIGPVKVDRTHRYQSSEAQDLEVVSIVIDRLTPRCGRCGRRRLDRNELGVENEGGAPLIRQHTWA